MLPKFRKPKKHIYLDHAAATPLDPKVKKVMAPFLNEKFGNPSALYKMGQEAKEAIEQSRKTTAKIINARPSEIIFTAGGTESVNLAIFGTARKYAESNAEVRGKKPHIITSKIEHDCVINSFKALKSEGFDTTFIKVDGEGFVNLDEIKKSVRKNTVLISIMYANNEIGTIEPIAEVGKWLKRENKRRALKKLPPILFHTDACQAAGFLDLDVNKLGVDLMSVNGSKIYGPKQTGFLFVRSGIKLKPIIYGGGQERDLRSGTENVAGIVGLAKALEVVDSNKLKINKKLLKLSGRLVLEIQKNIPRVFLNGPKFNQKGKLNRLPNNVNLIFKDVEGESLMLYLDSYGISASTSSACSTASFEPSHVLLGIGRTPLEAKSAIRFTLGQMTTDSDIKYLMKILKPLVKNLRGVTNKN